MSGPQPSPSHIPLAHWLPSLHGSPSGRPAAGAGPVAPLARAAVGEALARAAARGAEGDPVAAAVGAQVAGAGALRVDAHAGRALAAALALAHPAGALGGAETRGAVRRTGGGAGD